MRNRWLAMAGLLCAAAGYSYGSCTGSSPYACTGGGITIPTNSNNLGSLGSNAQTISALTGSITKVTVKLNNWVDDGSIPGDSDREMMLVFQPTGCTTSSCLQTFQFLGDFGSYDSLNFGGNGETVTFDDSATNYAPGFSESSGTPGDTPSTGNDLYKPTVNDAGTYCSGNGGQAAFGSPAPSSAPCATDNPSDNLGSDGHATFASQFSGNANGTWTLYVWSFAGGEDSEASIGSWVLTITTQANAANTTTSMSSNATNNETNEGTSVTFTATVSSTPTVSEGTVDFTDNGNSISGCGAVAVSNGTATCNTLFSTEGYHPLEAAYSGGTNFSTSHGNLNFFVDHATSNPSAGVYCNTGTISINTATQPGTAQYPQHITIPSTSATIGDISLTLNNVSTPDGIAFFNFLLVDPNGHKFVPMAGTGGNAGASNISLMLSDFGSATVPDNPSGAVASGTYLPTDLNSGLSFASSPYGPPSGPYSLPQSQGGATFDETFGGSDPSGQWSLYAYYSSGSSTASIGGYCLNLTTSNAAATATTVTSSPMTQATKGTQVTFTATVKSGGNAVNGGTVTFKENGTTLSGPTAVNGSGQVSFQTTSLSEGIHTITANYSGVTGTYNVSSSMVTIEIDTATTNPSAGVYCNPGGIASGTGTQNIPESPYPSRVNVAGVAGTVNTVKVELNNFSDTEPDGSVMLLEGPTSTNIVFWNNTGADGGFSSLNLTLADSAGSNNPVPENQNPSNNGTYYPTANTSPNPTPVFPAAAPTALSFAPPEGTQTFTNAFANINPNGYWSLFMYDRFGGQTVSINNWCVNVVNNPPVVTLSKVHNGTFTQGDTGDTYTITMANPSGPGSTAGTMTLTDTLPTGITATAMAQASGGTGSDWTCNAGTATCTRATPMPVGETDTITLTVNVTYNASTATNGAVNNVSLSGGGLGATVKAQDTQTVQAGQGYTLTVNVNPSGSGTVTANPTNSAGMAAGHYAPGTIVTLTANPAATYALSSWSGSLDLSSTSANPTTITMNSATESVTANFVVAYTNVSSSVSVTSTGLIYNKVKKQGTETVTVKNTSGATISGPIQLVLSGLPAGVAGANNTGTFNGNPYWTVTAGSLASGASASVTVTLAYASGTNFTATNSVYSGNLQ